MHGDFIMTLDSGDEDEMVEEVEVEVKKTGKEGVNDGLNPDFVFDLSGDPYVDVLGAESGDVVKTGSKPVRILWLFM